jgi:hypothetical protein
MNSANFYTGGRRQLDDPRQSIGTIGIEATCFKYRNCALPGDVRSRAYAR